MVETRKYLVSVHYPEGLWTEEFTSPEDALEWLDYHLPRLKTHHIVVIRPVRAGEEE